MHEQVYHFKLRKHTCTLEHFDSTCNRILILILMLMLIFQPGLDNQLR